MESLSSMLQTYELILFTLSTGAIVGIVVGSTIALTIGVLVGALLFYCIGRHWCQSSKAEISSHQQQQAGLLYEDVHGTSGNRKIDLRGNMAYGPVQAIELKANAGY